MPRKNITVGGTSQSTIKKDLELSFPISSILLNSIVIYMSGQDFQKAERERIYNVLINDIVIYSFAFNCRDDGLCELTHSANNLNKLIDISLDKEAEISIMTIEGVDPEALAFGSFSIVLNMDCVGQVAKR